jgi:hypothetical protein
LTTSSPIRCISWSRRSAADRSARRRLPLLRDALGSRLRLLGDGGGGAVGELDLGGGRRIDVRHGGRGRLDRGLLVVAREPDLDRVAAEALEVAVGGLRGEHLAVVGERCERHVRADRRHQRVASELDDDVVHRARVLGREQRLELELGRGLLFAVRALADERVQAADEGAFVEVVHAAYLDRLEGGAERVEALEQAADRVAADAAAPLAQQLEDVLHRVRQARDALEAHRRAHALQGMGDPEDLVERLGVVRGFLDADDREIQLLQMLAALREEHGEVFVEIHQTFR